MTTVTWLTLLARLFGCCSARSELIVIIDVLGLLSMRVDTGDTGVLLAVTSTFTSLFPMAMILVVSCAGLYFTIVSSSLGMSCGTVFGAVE